MYRGGKGVTKTGHREVYPLIKQGKSHNKYQAGEK